MKKENVQVERGIHELYLDDPIKADRELFGREADPVTRRGFLKKGGLLTMMGILGTQIPFAKYIPEGLIPAQLAYGQSAFSIPGKVAGLSILNDRPLNAETPPHLLDDEVTPAEKLFVRNNGIPPKMPSMNAWTLTIEGEAAQKSVTYTIAELKKKFKHYTYQIQLECGGNGRSEYDPPAKGNQWTTGAVGCPIWTGVRLKDVLKSVGIKSNAVYTGYYGADTHISGDPKKVVISRGVPIAKAMEDEALIAWAMNGADIPLLNGYPLRVVTGGWPGSTSGKWVKRIVIRDREHDGPKMTGTAYRVPCFPVSPGTKVSNNDMCIIESMPVKSLITFPKTKLNVKLGSKLPVRGHAWAGDFAVSSVDISIDFGATWKKVNLRAPKNRLAWQNWSTELVFPQKGYYEVWVRATDSNGRSQPMVVPGWNPKGYLNNASHRINLTVS